MREFNENLLYLGNLDVHIVEGKVPDHIIQLILQKMMEFQMDVESISEHIGVTVDFQLST